MYARVYMCVFDLLLYCPFLSLVKWCGKFSQVFRVVGPCAYYIGIIDYQQKWTYKKQVLVLILVCTYVCMYVCCNYCTVLILTVLSLLVLLLPVWMNNLPTFSSRDFLRSTFVAPIQMESLPWSHICIKRGKL